MKRFTVECNNKGLTLLEMIISVAIASIVIVTVTSFMVTGTKMFGNSNNEIQLQREVQLALSNVENRIIDAKRGVRCDDNATEVILTVFNEEKINAASNPAAKEYIVWDKSTKKIYYATSASTDTKTAAQVLAEKEVLASNVEDFRAVLKEGDAVASVSPNPSVTPDPSATPEPTAKETSPKPRVDITITLQEKGRKHTSQKVVAFRNDIKTNASADTIFTGTSNGLTSKAQNVKITPQDAYIVAGNSYKFNARVTGVGYPSQMVTWSVDGNPAGITIDNSGLVTVDGTAAAGGTVMVVATTPGDEDGNTISGSAKLHISKIDSITLTTNASKVYAGTMLKVNATVNGSELNDEMKKITWSIENNPGGVSEYSSSGVFGLDSSVRGKSFTIVATSQYNPRVRAELPITVENTAVSIGAGAVQANRNEYTELITNVVGENLAASELKITWSILDDGGLGEKVSVTPNGKVWVGADVNYENSYTVKVNAEINADRVDKPVSQIITVTIPAVSIHFVNGDGGAQIEKNGTVTLPYEVIGLNASPSQIYATTNPSIRNSIIYVTKDGVKLSIGSNVKSKKITVIATFKDTNTSASVDVTVK